MDTNGRGGFLSSCYLFHFVCTMSLLEVTRLSKTSEAETEVIQVRILLLTEVLQQLQIGKALRCSVCQIHWLQHGDNCYLFKSRQMSWISTMGFCKDESSSLLVIKSTEEMDFLMLESKKHLHLHRGRLKFNKFWIGLKYERSIGKWVWVDGSVLKVKRQQQQNHSGCMYLQNGEFHSQECSQPAFILCKAKVQLGWN
ncbi:C-type lectin domain family 12 member B-like [Pogona vitticeps]